MDQSQRAGVLVVAMWVDPRRDGFRARVTETSDVASVGEDTLVVGSIEDLLDAVRSWAHDVSADRRGPGPVRWPNAEA